MSFFDIAVETADGNAGDGFHVEADTPEEASAKALADFGADDAVVTSITEVTEDAPRPGVDLIDPEAVG